MTYPYSAPSQMRKLTKEYSKADSCAEPRCIHRTLLLRSLILLKNCRSESEEFFSPLTKSMMNNVKRPDRKGDYENGKGRHYYSSVTVLGRKIKEVSTYFRNGSGRLSPSARTMFEEDYTMALIMYRAGFPQKAAGFLGRAVHMLSDMCCLPHAASMTYFSIGRSFHKAYEELAEAIYPDFVPEQKNIKELPDIFSDRSNFSEALNKISRDAAASVETIKTDPLESVIQRLYHTEIMVASLLLRFWEDTASHEKTSHYITSGSGCRIIPDSPMLTVKITEKGLFFHGVNPCPESNINITDTAFYAAHRRDGLFTLSPAKDKKRRVLEISSGKIVLASYNPVHSEQLFRL